MPTAPRHHTHGRLAAALADLRYLEPNYDAAAKRMDDDLPGAPGGHGYDQGGGRSSDGTSSTERIGSRLAEGGDRARTICTERDQILDRLRRDADRLRTLVEANTPRAANPKARAAAEKANTQADPLCQHCSEWVKPGNVEPVHRTGDVAGNLPEPMALGRWCYDFVRTNGTLPTRTQVERHDQGSPVRVKVKA